MKIRNSEFIETLIPLLSTEKTVRFRIKGMSMYPLLRSDRDLVDLRRTNEPRMGDIVLARVSEDQYVLHRVIKKEGDRLTLMGDGNIYAKESCLCSDVIGKAVMVIRNGRSIDTKNIVYRMYSFLLMRMNPIKKQVYQVYQLARK